MTSQTSMGDRTKVNDKLLCPMAQITPSPVEKYYRNKCEFSFGLDTEDKPSVGFLLGLYKDGVTTVIVRIDMLVFSE